MHKAHAWQRKSVISKYKCNYTCIVWEERQYHVIRSLFIKCMFLTTWSNRRMHLITRFYGTIRISPDWSPSSILKWTKMQTSRHEMPNGHHTQDNQPAAIKVQVLTLCLSQESLAIVNNLGLTEEQKQDTSTIISTIKCHIDGQINESVEPTQLEHKQPHS